MPGNNNDFEHNFEDLSLDKIQELYNDIIELPEDALIAMCTSKCPGSDASCICIQ